MKIDGKAYGLYLLKIVVANLLALVLYGGLSFFIRALLPEDPGNAFNSVVLYKTIVLFLVMLIIQAVFTVVLVWMLFIHTGHMECDIKRGCAKKSFNPLKGLIIDWREDTEFVLALATAFVLCLIFTAGSSFAGFFSIPSMLFFSMFATQTVMISIIGSTLPGGIVGIVFSMLTFLILYYCFTAILYRRTIKKMNRSD